MSTSYYCSRSVCERDPDCENPTHERCDWEYVARASNLYMEPSFTVCPKCRIGHVLVYGKPHVPKVKKLRNAAKALRDAAVNFDNAFEENLSFWSVNAARKSLQEAVDAFDAALDDPREQGKKKLK